MAKLKFLGIAQAVSQVDEVTIGGTWSAGETARLTINGKFVQYVVVTSDTPALVAAGLQALAAADDSGEFEEIAFTVAGAKITATGTAGIPFTMTVAEASASGTIATTTTVNATGPNHWDNAVNWSTGSVPANSDEVFVELASVAIKYGFPTGLTLAKFVQSAGQVGIPDTNDAGFAEYRPTHLTIASAAVQIDGGTLSRIDTESANTVVVCQGRSVDLKVNHSSAQVHALAGTVRLGASDADAVQASVARCNPSASLVIGAGATVATVLTAGQCTIRGAITTLTVEGERCVLEGSSTTVNVKGGVFSYESVSTITTATVEAAGVFDCQNDIRAKTVTNFNLNGGQLSNPHRVITFTNGIQPGADLIQAS
jgi:hypothetical protein